ncbi:MAG: SDR family NAD(P)-dependent oxidoreductase [Candidatus Altiarchaeota archaeon]
MTVLVTGGAGFIGSHVCEKLLSRGEEVVCVDDLNDFYNPEVKKRNLAELECEDFKFVKADITEKASVSKAFDGVESVIHLAARAGVRPSIKNPQVYVKVNVEGTLNLLELCREKNIDNFVFGSSSSVYGVNEKVPFSEEDKVDNQISPYASSKLAGEALCHVYHHLYGMNISCLRFFTVYGPRGRPDMAVYKFTKAISEGEPIPVFGDGKAKRDYTYVSDIADGVVAAWEKKLGYEIINLGDSKTVELSYLISLIDDALGKKAVIEKKPVQAGDVPITYANISKAKKLLGYEPKVKIEEGIPLFVDWYNSL